MKSGMDCASPIDEAFDQIRYRVMRLGCSAEAVLSYLLSDYVSTMDNLSSFLTEAEQGDLKLGRQLRALLHPQSCIPLVKVKPGCSNPATLFATRNADRSPMRYFMLHLQHRSHLLRPDSWLTAIFTSFFSVYPEYRSLMNDHLLALLPVINYLKRDMEVACIELTQALLNRNVKARGHYVQNRLILLRYHFPNHLKPIIAEQVANEWLIGLYGVEDMYIYPNTSFVFNWLSPSMRNKVIQAAVQTKIPAHIQVASAWLKSLTYAERKMLNARLKLELTHFDDNCSFNITYPKLTKHFIDIPTIIADTMTVQPNQPFTLPALITLSQLSSHILVVQQQQVVTLILNRLGDLTGCCAPGFVLSLLKLKPWFDEGQQKLDLREHFLMLNTPLRNGPHGSNDPRIYALNYLEMLREMLTPDTIELIVRTLQENIEVHDNDNLIVLIEASVNFLKSWGPALPTIQRDAVYNTLMRFVQTQDVQHENHRNMLKLTLLVNLYQWPGGSVQDRALITQFIEPRFKAYFVQATYSHSAEWYETIIRMNPKWITFLIEATKDKYESRYCEALDRLSDIFSKEDKGLLVASLERGAKFNTQSWPFLRKWMSQDQRHLVANRQANVALEKIRTNYEEAALSSISCFFNQPALLDDVSPAIRLCVLFTMSNYIKTEKSGGVYEFLFYEHLQPRYNAYTTREYLRALPVNGQRHLLNDLAEKMVPIPNRPF